MPAECCIGWRTANPAELPTLCIGFQGSEGCGDRLPPWGAGAAPHCCRDSLTAAALHPSGMDSPMEEEEEMFPEGGGPSPCPAADLRAASLWGFLGGGQEARMLRTATAPPPALRSALAALQDGIIPLSSCCHSAPKGPELGAGSKRTAATGAPCPLVVTLCPPACHPAGLSLHLARSWRAAAPGECYWEGSADRKNPAGGGARLSACTPAAVRRRRVGSLHRAVSSSNGLHCVLKAQKHLRLREERGIPGAILFSPRVEEAQPSWTLLPSGQQPVPPWSILVSGCTSRPTVPRPLP